MTHWWFFFQNRAIRVRLATSIWYDTLMKNCFKDWSQSTHTPVTKTQASLRECTDSPEPLQSHCWVAKAQTNLHICTGSPEPSPQYSKTGVKRLLSKWQKIGFQDEFYRFMQVKSILQFFDLHQAPIWYWPYYTWEFTVPKSHVLAHDDDLSPIYTRVKALVSLHQQIQLECITIGALNLHCLSKMFQEHFSRWQNQ